jgi:hypothetical protein
MQRPWKDSNRSASISRPGPRAKGQSSPDPRRATAPRKRTGEAPRRPAKAGRAESKQAAVIAVLQGRQGARPTLDHEMLLLDTLFDLPSIEGVDQVVISKRVVEGTARPLYIYADRANDVGASA